MEEHKPTRLTPAQQRRLARQRFQRARIAEQGFQRQLSGVARQVGNLVRGMAPNGNVKDPGALRTALIHYSSILHPWASAVVARMQSQVSQRDLHAWAEAGRLLGRRLKKELSSPNAVQAVKMRTIMSEQVHLITSLPLEAAERVHTLARRLLVESGRAEEIKKDILRSGQVTLGRAKTIARTEVARTASVLTQSRAEYIGSEGYIWRTSGDVDVRPTHRKLEGKFQRWDTPPVSEADGKRSHAGQIFNCRCWPEPVIPDLMERVA